MIDLRVLTFAEAKQPKFSEKKGKDGGFITYGEKNDYPQYLVNLFNKSPKHNAILRSKVHYIAGNGWSGGDDAQNFINNANRNESLFDLTKKLSTDIELFGGAYIEVIWNVLGQIAELWHIDFTKIRTNKDNTQFWYKCDWNDSKEEAEIIQAFNPAIEGKSKQILFIKEYRPNIGVYPLPSYFGSLNYIEADVEVSKHVLGNAQTGFSASKLITLPNGEPTDEEKGKIDKQIREVYSGSDGKKFMVSFVTDVTRKPIIDDLGNSDLTKEDFGRVDTLIQTNIFSGHQITTPSIFGIAEAGKLGSRTEMRDGYEIFKNTYVNAKQMFIESLINKLTKYTNVKSELKIIPTEPIGFEFSENTLTQIAPKEWLLEKAGIDITKYQPAQPEVQNTPTPTPIQQNESKKDNFDIFFKLGESKEAFNIWQSRKRFSDESDMLLFADTKQLEANILEQINKQKDITPEVLAEVLGEDVATIEQILSDLEQNGKIKSTEKKIGTGINQDIVIERELTSPLSESVDVKPETTSIMVKYSYEWKAGFTNANIGTSRDFCVALLEANKLYSRAEIETMSAELGYSVWDRKGGWYTKPNGERSPECRHEWKTNIVTRKK